MRYVRQLFIILCVSFTGEILHAVVPLPVPACIWGLLLMLALLLSGWLKLSYIAETADFLVEILSMTFVPVSVGLMLYGEIIGRLWLPLLILLLPGTALVFLASGRTVQAVLKRSKS